ncbi:MAG TPA: TetR/AcrR family transcriptional regulator [Vicinamibacteria bacterium]|nr:TetR/AcrR family transcriptional regulator [Vicinamibacteria bacterium]
MQAPTTAPRDRLLQATETMLREAGMAGTGIKEVVKRSGAPIGSLYHYFPGGKTQLVTEALEVHSSRSHALIARFFDGRTSAATAVRRLFDTAAEGFDRAGADKGCAIGAVSLDLQAGDTQAQRICEATFKGWAERIEPHLPFTSKSARASFAVTVVAALEGAFVLARAARSGAPFRDVGKSLEAALRRA